MARAEDLFQKGDYASAGRIARQVKEAGDEEARARAHTLLERLPPSPLAKYLLLLTLLLLIAVTVFAYGN